MIKNMVIFILGLGVALLIWVNLSSKGEMEEIAGRIQAKLEMMKKEVDSHLPKAPIEEPATPESRGRGGSSHNLIEPEQVSTDGNPVRAPLPHRPNTIDSEEGRKESIANKVEKETVEVTLFSEKEKKPVKKTPGIGAVRAKTDRKKKDEWLSPEEIQNMMAILEEARRRLKKTSFSLRPLDKPLASPPGEDSFTIDDVKKRSSSGPAASILTLNSPLP